MSLQYLELNDVCSLITDGTHYTPPNIGKGFPFLTVRDVTSSGLDFHNCSRITQIEFDKADSGNSVPKVGDVLFSKDGTVGKVFVVKNKKQPFAILSSLAILRPSKNLDSNYLGHVLKNPITLRQASKSKTGSALRRIILADLKRLKIPVPPINEQKRIATILDKADAIRRKRQQVIQLADEFLRSVFLDMFGDPMTNSKNWELKLLSDVAPAKPIRSVSFNNEDDVWLLNLDKVESNTGTVLKKNMCKLYNVGNSTSWFDNNHVLYSKLRPYLNKVVLPDEMGVATTELLPLKPDVNFILREYLATYLRTKSFVDWANSKVAGAKMPRLSTSELWKYLLPIPPMDLQLKFVDIFNKTMKNKSTQNKFNLSSEELFKSISQKAFSGEL